MLCFFGGYFATLTAAVEAYRITGWERTRDALCVIARNVEAAQRANMKDDELDEDGNGIPDTQEISRRELVVRKIGVVAKAINPDQMTEALNAVYMGFVAVVATLRVHFAACVSLGFVLTISHVWDFSSPDVNKLRLVLSSMKYACNPVKLSRTTLARRTHQVGG